MDLSWDRAALAQGRTARLFLRYVAFRHDASMHKRGRSVTDRNATHEKRHRVERALVVYYCVSGTCNIWKIHVG